MRRSLVLAIAVAGGLGASAVVAQADTAAQPPVAAGADAPADPAQALSTQPSDDSRGKKRGKLARKGARPGEAGAFRAGTMLPYLGAGAAAVAIAVVATDSGHSSSS